MIAEAMIVPDTPEAGVAQRSAAAWRRDHDAVVQLALGATLREIIDVAARESSG